jgi:hypothetical protein
MIRSTASKIFGRNPILADVLGTLAASICAGLVSAFALGALVLLLAI